MTSTKQLVKHVVGAVYSDLPVEVHQPTKVQVLDTLGVTVAGTAFGTLDPLIDLVKKWGGKKEATIAVYGDKVPAHNAAMVNGHLGSVLDYEDIYPGCNVHASTSTVVPGFAMAEYMGGVNGKAFMSAIALGFDLTVRLGRACKPQRQRFFPTEVSKYFGAAAVSGKLLNLGETEMENALSIVMEEASRGTEGSSANAGGSGPCKGAIGGLASRSGITAALLAKGGMTGISDPIEGPYGFYSSVYADYIPEMLTVGLGKVYTGLRNAIKIYPSCHATHNALDATLALVKEHDIKPEDVHEVTVHTGPFLAMFQPKDVKYNPQDLVQCGFSMPWTLASAIMHGKLGIDNFSEQNLHDKRTLTLAQKVTYELEPEFADVTITSAVVVEIKMESGKAYSKRVDRCLGTPENPAGWDIIVDKFRDCCAHAIKPIAQKNVEKVVSMVESLEDVADVTEIMHLLA